MSLERNTYNPVEMAKRAILAIGLLGSSEFISSGQYIPPTSQGLQTPTSLPLLVTQANSSLQLANEQGRYLPSQVRERYSTPTPLPVSTPINNSSLQFANEQGRYLPSQERFHTPTPIPSFRCPETREEVTRLAGGLSMNWAQGPGFGFPESRRSPTWIYTHSSPGSVSILRDVRQMDMEVVNVDGIRITTNTDGYFFQQQYGDIGHRRMSGIVVANQAYLYC